MDEKKIVNDFGDEWEKFNQFKLTNADSNKISDDYFYLMPWNKIKKNSEGIDVGCGTGRWAQFVLPRCKKLSMLDASHKSISIAKRLLKKFNNTEFILSDVTNMCIENNKYDFAYSLGVLHHVPNIEKAISEINRILKPGAPFLIYLYYSFDNAPKWYKLIWDTSDFFRKIISDLPKSIKMPVCEIIAFFIYLPLARLALILDKFKINLSYFPLSYYRNKSFYTMRTDSLDRFGTSYEKRYSQKEIKKLLEINGFHSIVFSAKKPFWCALAYKR